MSTKKYLYGYKKTLKREKLKKKKIESKKWSMDKLVTSIKQIEWIYR